MYLHGYLIHTIEHKVHKEMESVRDPNMDPPDRRQVWKALNFKCHLFLKEVGKN